MKMLTATDRLVGRVLLVAALLLALVGVRALADPQTAAMTSAQVRAAADTSRELRVVVSLDARRLWVIDSVGDTLRTASVAVGSGRRLTVGGRTWRFATPVGIRRVLSTEVDPVWIRPDWAYVELARSRKLRLDSVSSRRPHAIGGGDSLVARGGEIGVVKNGVFRVWPFDRDIAIRGVLYMPPLGSPYRMLRGALGQYRLNLGNAVGFHGTLEKESIGRAVTHGCMRLHDEDVEWLYLRVPVGTPVFIY
jgi:lipoprotein-anchoring transpeptidase ErfK/SrfK